MSELNRIANNTESYLSIGAAFPVAGTVCGAVKVVLGSFQALTGLVLGIITLPLQCTEDASFNDHCWNHLKHGIGNIIAGTFEAIPLVGTIMFFTRSFFATCGCTDDDGKFMPYHKGYVEL